MARLNDTVRTALGYWWNLITDAVRTGLTVTDTTQLANQVAHDFNTSLSFDENKAISQLYGYAKRIENAGLEFQAADPGQGITADMISTPPYARDLQEQATYPLYHVKFAYTYIGADGLEHTEFKTSVQPLTLGATVADVTTDVVTDAEAFAKKYGHQLVSAVPLQILAV